MYAPLEFISQSEQVGREFESRKELLIKQGCDGLEDMTSKQYIDFLFSSAFMNSEYDGVYKDINKLLLLNSDDLLKTLGYTYKDVKDKKVDIATEWKDIYLAPILIEKWGKNKQVYKPNPVFAEILIYTEKLQLVKTQLEHLPVEDIYLDLSDCKIFEPIVGIFVHVHRRATGVDITQYLLTNQMIFFSFYGGGIYNENNIIEFNIKDLPTKEYSVSAPFANPAHKFKFAIDRRYITIFAMQMLCYIASKEPDIRESPLTKNTFRPTTNIKNKFSEVQEWDVGIKYGKPIYTSERKGKGSINNNTAPERVTSEKARKSPSPHYRCAHWQHYWTGKGRKIYEVRWIEPSYVGFANRENIKTDVVIHKVG